MDHNLPPQSDAFLYGESSEADAAALRAALESTNTPSKKAVAALVAQHFVHGLLASEADSVSGASKARTERALAQLQAEPAEEAMAPATPLFSLSARRWASAALLMLAVGIGAFYALSDQGEATPPVEPNANAKAQDTSVKIDEAIVRQTLENGFRYANLSKDAAVLELEQGGLITLDGLSSLVVVDGGNRLSELKGRIGIEGAGMRVAIGESDAILLGGPAVAVFNQGYLEVFSGKFQATNGDSLAIGGERLDLASLAALPFDAGKLPEFIAAARVPAVLADLQTRVGNEITLDSATWTPVLTALLAEPVGREMARQSVENLLIVGVTKGEFAELMQLMDMSLRFLIETEGVEKATAGVRAAVESWRAASPEQRSERLKKSKKALEMWRGMSEEQRAMWRQFATDRLDPNKKSKDGSGR